MKLPKTVRRFFLGLVIYSKEIELSDIESATRAINRLPEGAIEDRDSLLKALSDRQEFIAQKLSAKRSEFNALLPVGQRRTWRIG